MKALQITSMSCMSPMIQVPKFSSILLDLKVKVYDKYYLFLTCFNDLTY